MGPARVRALALLAAAVSCGGGVPRIPDAPAPQPAMARVNLAPVAFAERREVTRSPKLKDAAPAKVLLSFAGGAADARARGELERLVRKALLGRRVEVVAAEVRAKLEAERGRKERLSEAEELILLGKETGAEAILVFDQLGVTGALQDISLGWNARSAAFDALPSPPAASLPACPTGFRAKMPTLIARGRMVSAADATILAEFNMEKPLLDRREALAAPADVVRVYPSARRARETYREPGCGAEYHEYEYIAEWQAVDVLCAEVQKRLAPHIPPPGGSPALVEAGVEEIVAGILGR